MLEDGKRAGGSPDVKRYPVLNPGYLTEQTKLKTVTLPLNVESDVGSLEELCESRVEIDVKNDAGQKPARTRMWMCGRRKNWSRSLQQYSELLLGYGGPALKRMTNIIH
ncbi:unnamed protein product, partial [Iphiclides podalirius]